MIDVFNFFSNKKLTKSLMFSPIDNIANEMCSSFPFRQATIL